MTLRCATRGSPCGWCWSVVHDHPSYETLEVGLIHVGHTVVLAQLVLYLICHVFHLILAGRCSREACQLVCSQALLDASLLQCLSMGCLYSILTAFVSNVASKEFIDEFCFISFEWHVEG